MLARKPSDTVRLHRCRQISFEVGSFSLAPEYVVAAEGQQPDAEFLAYLCQVPYGDAIYEERLLGLFLAQWHVVERGAIDDDFRPQAAQRRLSTRFSCALGQQGVGKIPWRQDRIR